MARADPILPAVSIKTRILFSFLAVILVLSVAIAAPGYRVTQKDIFDSSTNSLAAMAVKKGLRISNEVSPDLMQIVANNLISNAIKYSPNGGEIRVTAAPLDGIVEVDVYKDSTPMTDEQRARLFQKFSRLDNPETKKVKGTGLGLYITRQIIERHGGTIAAVPHEHGNSFIFRIERS